MSVSDNQPNAIDQLAEDFLQRYRSGESPKIDAYVQRHPELEAEIRDVFPTLILMEDVRPRTLRHFRRSDAAPEIIGDYRIIGELGRGGMGVVYEAEQIGLGRRVALKILPAERVSDAKSLIRFRREAQAAARLHHSNIVPVFDIGYRDGMHFYAMQFIQGKSLDVVMSEVHVLRRQLADNNGMSVPYAVSDSQRSLAESLVLSNSEFHLNQNREIQIGAKLRHGTVLDRAGTRVAYVDQAGQLVVSGIGGEDLLAFDTQGVSTSFIAFSPGAKFICISSNLEGGQVQAWNLELRKPVFESPLGNCFGVAISSDDHWIACGHSDHTIKVYQTASGQLQTTLIFDRQPAWLAFHPTRSLIAVSFLDRGPGVEVWDFITGKQTHEIICELEQITSVAWHPAGKLLAMSGGSTRSRLRKRGQVQFCSARLIIETVMSSRAVAGIYTSMPNPKASKQVAGG